MRQCEQYRDQLDAWLDEELPPAELDAVRRHLAECAACRATFAAQRGLQANLAALGRVADAMCGFRSEDATANAPHAAVDGTDLRRTSTRTGRPILRLNLGRAIRIAAMVAVYAGLGGLAMWSWQNAPPIRHVADQRLADLRRWKIVDRDVSAESRVSRPGRSGATVRPLIETQLAMSAPTVNPRISVVWLYEMEPHPEIEPRNNN